MTTSVTTKEVVTLARLREGPVYLGKGISVSAVMNEQGRIAFINFTHPTKDGGTCTKGLPIKKKTKDWWKRSYFENWSLWIERDRSITVAPSVLCREHDVHGLIRNGKWKSLSFELWDQEQEVVERKIDKAIEDAEKYGGGYWGAILALAASKWS